MTWLPNSLLLSSLCTVDGKMPVVALTDIDLDALALLAFHLGVSPHRIADARIHRVVACRSADARWLAKRIMRCRGPARLLVRAGRKEVRKKADLEDLLVIRGRFVEGHKQLSRIPGLSDETRRRGLALPEAARTPESSRLAPRNDFGLLLLQLLPWMCGFYRGRLDGRARFHGRKRLAPRTEFSMLRATGWKRLTLFDDPSDEQ